MDKRVVDISGLRFGAWTVISYFDRHKTDTRFYCKCDCGTEKVVIASSLKKGVSLSCGCISRKISSLKNTKHGMASTPTYKSWHSMHQRVLGKGGHESYPLRGIEVCAEWHSFDQFLSDMGIRPDGTTLDRIDNQKGYSKDNCRWADAITQANNKSNNRFFDFGGLYMTAAQASRHFGIGISCLRHRLRKGMLPADAVAKPDGRFQKE